MDIKKENRVVIIIQYYFKMIIMLLKKILIVLIPYNENIVNIYFLLMNKNIKKYIFGNI